MTKIRDWPINLAPRPRRRGQIAALWMVSLLLLLGPLVSWGWAVAPGGPHPWAPFTWPAFWGAAVILFCVMGFVVNNNTD